MKRFNLFLIVTFFAAAGLGEPAAGVFPLVVPATRPTTAAAVSKAAAAADVPDVPHDETWKLQQLLDAAGKLEPNAQEFTRENLAPPIVLTKSILLTRPLRVTSNVVLDGTLQRFALVWLGKGPGIYFGSNVGHGGTSDIGLINLTLFMPFADRPWAWDKTAFGNAGVYTLHGLRITTAGVKIDLRAPGDGNAYWFDVDDCVLKGAGGPCVVGRPITGRINNVRWINQPGPGPMFDISGSCTITNCWAESNSSAGILTLRGPYSFVKWEGNHNEPHVPCTQFTVDGGGDVTTLLADALYFVSPGLPCEVKNGGVIQFMGGHRPSVSFNNGWNPDPRIPSSLSAADRAADVAAGGKVGEAFDQLQELLRRSYHVTGRGSCVQWAGGQLIDSTAPILPRPREALDVAPPTTAPAAH